jgi:hypothetical protein
MIDGEFSYNGNRSQYSTDEILYIMFIAINGIQK